MAEYYGMKQPTVPNIVHRLRTTNMEHVLKKMRLKPKLSERNEIATQIHSYQQILKWPAQSPYLNRIEKLWV